MKRFFPFISGGVGAGLLAAVLFGLATPASKLMLSSLTPFQLAGILYLGAALATLPPVVRNRRSSGRLHLDRTNRIRLGVSVVLGGCVGPVLLLAALNLASAGSVSLLLNLELAATAVLGTLFFREHLHLSGLVGVGGVVAAGMVLSAGSGLPGILAGVAVVTGCLCWGMDNHLTALIDQLTPEATTFWKGLVAGSVNLGIGLLIAPLQASGITIALALIVGALSYGASVVLYIVSAQQLGATRAQGLFASAPFIGAVLSFVLLREPVGMLQLVAIVVLVASIVLILRGHHSHAHHHEAVDHLHRHRHDDGHHLHAHPGLPLSTCHTHAHHHDALGHCGPHWPDIHHRHSHSSSGTSR